jgi:hypothetical protein
VAGGRYNPDSTGTYRVWAADGSFRDTCAVTVLHGRTVRLVVLPDTARITTDSTLRLAATAYDADRNGWVVTDSSVWTDTDPRITVANGVYNPDRVGNYTVTATYNGYADTSAVFVAVGALFDVRIQLDSAGAGRELGDTTLEAGWNLRLVANAYDRDSNFISLLPVTWSFIAVNKANNIDSLGPASNAAVAWYYPRRTGTCKVRAFHPQAADTTGTLTTLPSSILHHYVVTTDQRFVDINAQVTCSLKVYDRFNNLMTNYGASRHPIQIQVVYDPRTKAEDRGQAVMMGSGVTGQDDSTGTIAAGTPFTNGCTNILFTYNATEDSLWFRFTEDSSGITGTSPSVVWKDPNILSHVVVYPNPYTMGMRSQPNNVVGVRITYTLRDNSTVWIRIFSAEGTFVWEKAISRGQAGGRPGHNEVIWDGTNARGRYVGTGAYIMKMWVESPRGPAGATRKIGVVSKER